MCDKKNNVLFNDTECIVLSPNFKLIDESQVLLRVPRKNNMYSVDLKNIVPKGGLTCLFAKATSDESKLWHRRLGHLNFKTMNKLVKGNLVRGLPSKLFENDQTCVACQKGKQHRASCKSKTKNSISLPLHLLHMDLFGPIFVKNLMKKMYCIVVTDDYSRFTWVFFLATKDETSGILKSFITGIENLVDHKVKVIRYDNGTKFKNREMNQFCEKKEAVNTACYVQNIVLVVKLHNKTPYELFHGRTPTLSFMRPFGCHVTILNTIDHLGKFDGKADEGSGPNWLFDIDALTRIMNYRSIVAGTQSNSFADDGSKPLCDDENKVDEDPRKDSESIDQEKDDNVNNTNNVNAVSTNEVNAVEADMNNLDTTIQVSSIPTTRIHKDHPLNKVIGDLQSSTQTRNMLKNLEEHGFEEPKKVIHALKDPRWIEAIQEELLQFKLQEVWTLVDLPNGKRVIGTKWVFRNKKDERGIVIRNKERLVAQGYTQEEGIDYDEVFAHVARIEAIRLFLAYASFNDFVVYQMNVKSAFLYGKIEEELLELVYVDDIIFGSTKKELCNAFEKLMHEKFQMSSMGELTFFLGLQVQQKKDGIFIIQDKYVGDILKKFGFVEVKTASTQIETQKPLLKDENGKEVDVHMYRLMIGSLMYLTSSRPDIMFAVCACARYQVNPKVSHLHAMKRIFRYLKGQPKLGLWYPKDSPFDLVAYTDSDYARASLDRKSTTGGCQFLGSRLISWQCKKQTVVANFTTEAEYLVSSSCCRQVLWIQNQLLDYGVVKTINGEVQLHALVDGKKIIISKASVRSDLQLEDEEVLRLLHGMSLVALWLLQLSV
ncbi:putative ribonuclease H-like domain-containing protein [Tanacetum coccineum]|uniref:Ribonuclease H-like domain-containing protein n=1 Tax=Tanacetum coccineum TaxID=301880 RepID=A0ABQ4YA39_9ASTR